MKLRKKIIFSLSTLGFFLFTMEMILSLSGSFYPARVLCYDFILGDVYCPNTEGRLHSDVKKHIKVNSDGLVDDEYPVERVPGKLRIAVLGDSFTAAEEISPGKKFHDIWEKRLPAILGRPVEVINFGLRGKGTWEELQIFHLKTGRYKPDLTVLVFFWGNDVENNVLALKNNRFNPLLNEYPEVSAWDRFLIRRRNFNKWLWNHSALYQFTRTRYNNLEFKIKSYLRSKYIESIDSPKNGGHAMPRDQEPSQVRNMKPGKDDPASLLDDKYFFDSEGWELTKKLILRLRDEVQDGGGKFSVVHFVGHDNLKLDLPFPVSEFNFFLAREKINYIDLSLKLGNIDDELNENLIPGDFHFSEVGHENFAEFTVNLLAETLADEK